MTARSATSATIIGVETTAHSAVAADSTNQAGSTSATRPRDRKGCVGLTISRDCYLPFRGIATSSMSNTRSLLAGIFDAGLRSP